MKRTIIVVDDFSPSAHNAMDYGCRLAADADARVVILRIYTLPVSYSSDAIALSTLKDDYDTNQDRLEHDANEWHERFPDVHIDARLVTGGLIECLRDQVYDVNPDLIVMGAPRNYDELWTWDSEMLNSLTALTAPVLLIPMHIKYKATQNIGFACDYQTVLVPGQVNFLKLLIHTTHARLHVVPVATKAPRSEEIAHENEAMINELLTDIQPTYYKMESQEVIESIAHFVKEHNLDFLVVIPHRHGIWYNIFHQSHTKQLAKLNHIPVLALQD